MNIFVFDIETVPDVEAGRQIYDLEGLDDRDVAEALFMQQRKKSGNEFLPHYLHQIVAISVVFRSHDQLKVWSLGEADSKEAELIERFFDGIDKYSPTLVSWNGGGFDLPVLHYRALKHGVTASQYWDMGQLDSQFKWNNYISRYHARHTDLMDLLAMYTGRANAPLDHIATLLGFPGKMGMDGSKVWPCFLSGDVSAIRDYCETDVLNTYLVYLRFELMRGHLSEKNYQLECEKLRVYLQEKPQQHFHEFLSIWEQS